jgi:hypothetical protein
VIRGNFIGVAIVAAVNVIIIDLGGFRNLSRVHLIILNVVLDFLIILFMALAFK